MSKKKTPSKKEQIKSAHTSLEIAKAQEATAGVLTGASDFIEGSTGLLAQGSGFIADRIDDISQSFDESIETETAGQTAAKGLALTVIGVGSLLFKGVKAVSTVTSKLFRVIGTVARKERKKIQAKIETKRQGIQMMESAPEVVEGLNADSEDAQ